MQRALTTSILALSLGTTAGAQWHDDFDAYSPGPLSTQSGWEQWDNQTSVDGDVTSALPFTAPHSLVLRGDTGPDPGDNVLYDFANLPGGRPTTGTWIMSVKTYVPSGASGASYVSMLNEYVPGVAANWSLNVVFSATTGEVLSRPGKEVLPLIYGEWVSFYVCIDLDDDRVDMFYGNQTLVSDQSWKNDFSGGGQE